MPETLTTVEEEGLTESRDWGNTNKGVLYL